MVAPYSDFVDELLQNTLRPVLRTHKLKVHLYYETMYVSGTIMVALHKSNITYPKSTI